MKEDKDTLKIKPIKVLIAEDDEASEYFLITVVELFSKQILIAHTGEETIELCKKHPDIDLILMDIKFNGIDGYAATKEIRSFNKTIIIIAQTAYSFADDKKKAFKSGCDDYVSKPINKLLLLDKIRKFFPK